MNNAERRAAGAHRSPMTGGKWMDKMLDASARAAVDYKMKVTAQQIAANTDLANYQRQMARELPVLRFNPRQEEQFIFPEFR